MPFGAKNCPAGLEEEDRAGSGDQEWSGRSVWIDESIGDCGETVGCPGYCPGPEVFEAGERMDRGGALYCHLGAGASGDSGGPGGLWQEVPGVEDGASAHDAGAFPAGGH